MKKIDINLKSDSYSVFVGNNILQGIIKKYDWKNTSKILIITDSNVALIYRNFISEIFKVTGREIHIHTIKAGEESKSFNTLIKIYSYLIANSFGRDSFIVAFGGGVVGDVAGFAASTFMRGIQYCQIPTTLLASVDSSVGGKTGINFNKTKNIIGSFYQPKFVVADSYFFNSLPNEEWLCGLGEILKYCFLSDYSLFNFFNNNFNKIWNRKINPVQKIIIESLKIKSSVVSRDEKEKSLRKILNLGHTFAHSFESVLNYKIKHGEAVVAGIGCASILSNEMGILNDIKLLKFFNLINKFQLNIRIKDMSQSKLFNAMLRDKKNKNGKIKFVLIKDIGRLLLDMEASKREVLSSLERFNEYYKPGSNILKV